MSNVYPARAALPWTRPAGVELVRVGVGTTVSVRPAPTPFRITCFPYDTHRPTWRWTFKVDGLDYQALVGIEKQEPGTLPRRREALFLIGPDRALARLSYRYFEGPAQLQGYGRDFDVKTFARWGLFYRGTEVHSNGVLVLSCHRPNRWRKRVMAMHLHDPDRMPLPLLAFVALGQSMIEF